MLIQLTLAPFELADVEQSDLEELLDEAIQVDFNVQAEDDSPYQVCISRRNFVCAYVLI